MSMKTLFVTVGTTRFDDLVNEISQLGTLTSIVDLGFTHLTIQHGKSPFQLPISDSMKTSTTVNGKTSTTTAQLSPRTHHQPSDDSLRSRKTPSTATTTPTSSLEPLNLTITAFDYQPNLDPYLTSATLVISHAGTGSILGALRAKKPLICVPNPVLMHNHQAELAEAMAEEGVLVACQLGEVGEALKSVKWKQLKPWETGDPARFVRAVEEVAGYI